MDHDRQVRFARHPGAVAIHLVVGAVGIAAGFYLTENGTASAMLVLASMTYVAWMTGRSAGIGLAWIAASLHLLQAHDRQSSSEMIVFPALWLVLYLVVVVISSAIETATRPKI